MKHRILAALVIVNLPCSISLLVAQETTTLPTSMYGIGELSTSDGGQYSGIGNTGVALNINNNVNILNPAAITQMDSVYFRYNVGSIMSYTSYSLYGARSNSFTGTLSRLTAAVRLTPRWFAILGLAPFSSVGYSIQESSQVEGQSSSSITSTYEGSGGLYRLYLTNAFKLTRNLSLGVSVGYLHGTVYQSESQESASVNRESMKSSLYAEGGLHYILPLRKGRSFTFGATYMPRLLLSQDNTLTYSNTSGSDDYEDDFTDEVKYVPQLARLGMGYQTPHWTFLADYSWQDWSITKSSLSTVSYKDQQKIGIGTIYKVKDRNPQSVEFMAGAELSNSYVVIKKQTMKNLGLSIGVTAPFKGTMLSFGFTWKNQLNNSSMLMKENRFSFNFGINFREKIFKGNIE